MNEIEQLISEIQAMLVSEADPSEADLSRLYDEYVDAVTKCNQRLRRCDELLRKGHRAEVIHQCEIEPQLLSVVDTLDFPEHETWFEFVRQFGRPAPPDLLVDVAADLNSAYADEEPLSLWMKKHRRHALEGSPLGTRINIMRRIRRLDSHNPIWERDIREFEKVRHGQIVAEAELAGSDRNLDQLTLLAREANSKEWLEQPPAEVTQRTLSIYTQVARQDARDRLEVLADKLMAAHSTFDVPACQILRDEWQQTLEIAKIPQGDPLHEDVAPAFEWLAGEEDEQAAEQMYDELVSDLEFKLEEQLKREELEETMYRLRQLGRGVPTVLEQRLEDRLRSIEDETIRRNRLVVVGLLLMALLMAGGTALGVRYVSDSRALAAHVATVGNLLKQENYTGCQEYLAKLSEAEPQYYDSPEIAQLEKKLNKAIADENARSGAFLNALSVIEDMLAEPDWPTLDRAEAKLGELEQKALTHSEQNSLVEVGARVAAARRTMQSEVDTRFEESAQAFSDQCAQLEEEDQYDLGRLNTLISEGRSLLNRPYVSPELKSAVELRLARLSTFRDTAMTRNDELGRLKRITNAVGRVPLYAAALEAYPKAEGASPSRVEAFKKVVTEAVLWSLQEEWNQLNAKWSKVDLGKLTPTDAKRMLDEYQALVQKEPNFPTNPGYEDAARHIEALVQRTDQDARTYDQELSAVLGDPYIAEVFLVKTKDGKKYYCKKRPRLLGERWLFNYLIDTGDVGAEERGGVTVAALANETVDGQVDWLSPQSHFRNMAIEMLGRKNNDNWEVTVRELITALYQNQELEPVLKLLFLQKICQVAMHGSYCYDQAYKGIMEKLKNADIAAMSAENWLDQEDVEGEAARTTAEGVLASLGEFNKGTDEAGRLFAESRTIAFGPQLQWVGWIHRSMDEKRLWKCTLNPNTVPPGDHELLVIYKDADDQPAVSDIGTLSSGKATIADRDGAFLEGRPAYISVAGQ